jgi:hypothetical protein
VVGDYRKFTAYEGTASILVLTSRAKIDQHAEKLAKCRYALSPENNFLCSEFYQILETSEDGASTELEPDLNADATLISFSVKFFLKQP